MIENKTKNGKGHVSFRSLCTAIAILIMMQSEHSFINAFQMASRTSMRRGVQIRLPETYLGSLVEQRKSALLNPLHMSSQSIENNSNHSQLPVQSLTTTRRTVQHKVSKTVSLFSGLFLASLKGAKQAIRQSWWFLPMFLALVPVYCAVVHQTNAVTPSWWKLVKMDTLLKSEYSTLLVGAFLLSNLSYLFSGLYLLLVFPKKVIVEKKMKQAAATSKNRHPLPHHNKSLASWILAAGTVSTIFHAVQSLGSYEIAESFCYLDHAVAISAGGYFLRRCGKPSLRTLTIGVSGLILLCLTGPGYAFLHSMWHLVSAAAAVSWAHDGTEKKNSQQQQQQIREINQSKPATA